MDNKTIELLKNDDGNHHVAIAVIGQYYNINEEDYDDYESFKQAIIEAAEKK